jgi:UDP-N-acetylmuramoyl-tripeptide--D-alanyl-D-alanine ligase
MRGVLHALPNGVHLLDDSYNSNPAAMDRAMEMLSDASPDGRRILVAGDMLELGPHEERAHTRIGELVAAAGIDLFVAVGARSERAVAAARASGSTTVHHFATSEEAAPFVASEARRGDLVLVKGSRGMKMERVVEALISAGGCGVEGIS